MSIDTLKKWIHESDSIVFFGGAGVSTASGIPDFRGKNGLNGKYNAEIILSRGFFEMHTEEFFDFYRAHMLYTDAQPNIVHRRLAELEKRRKLNTVITQNIDGLHTKAGSKKILEIHGSIYYNYCMRCGKSHNVEKIKESAGIPRCECGGIIKPDVVLYDEPLNQYMIDMANAYAQAAEVLIVGGTSLKVYPAAGIVENYMGRKLVLINKEETSADKYADLVIHGDITEVFKEL